MYNLCYIELTATLNCNIIEPAYF